MYFNFVKDAEIAIKKHFINFKGQEICPSFLCVLIIQDDNVVLYYSCMVKMTVKNDKSLRKSFFMF